MAKRRNDKSLGLSRRIQALFGSRLQAARRDANPRVEQSELAQALGITRTSVSNMENGRHRVALDQVYAAARALRVPVSKLLPEIDDAFEGEDLRLSPGTEVGPRAASALRGMVKRVYESRSSDLERGFASDPGGRTGVRKK